MKKVHTKVIIDMASGEVLEDVFYWYEGDWEKCKDVYEDIIEGTKDTAESFKEFLGGGGDPSFPSSEAIGPATPPPGSSPAEINEFNLAMEEFQLLQRGWRKVPTAGGGFKIQEIPNAELEALLGGQAGARLRIGRAINLRGLQRTEAAFRDDLPVSPGFEREATKRREEITLGLRRGAGVTSTAGIQQLGREQEGTNIAREQIRTGEITSGFARSQLQQQTAAQAQSQMLQGFQQGRFGQAQLGLGYAQLGQQLNLSQQDRATQLQIAQLMGRYGQQAGKQELFGTLLTGGAIIAASDKRLKENIKKLEPTTEIIEQMRPVTFNYKKNKKQSIGLIAQELQEIVPEAIIEIDDKGTLGINYNVIVPLLIKAVQELNDKIKDK